MATLFKCQYSSFLCLQLAGIADHTWWICHATFLDLDAYEVSVGSKHQKDIFLYLLTLMNNLLRKYFYSLLLGGKKSPLI